MTLSMQVLQAALVLLLLYIPLSAYFNHRKLRQFPGPALAGYSRLWIFYQSLRARFAKAEIEALRTYGSPCRVGPDLLVTDDPDVVRHLSAAGSKWTRSGWYEGVRLDPRHESVFSTRDEGLHAELKAKESGAYSGRDIATLESDIDTRTSDLLTLIRTHHDGKVVDIAAPIRFYTLDVLSTVAFGRPFGFMTANADLWDYDRELSQMHVALEWVVNHASFRRIFQSRFLQSLAGPKETDKTGMGPVLAFAHKAVAERFVEKSTVVKNDMLGHFVGKGLSQLQCEVEAKLQIVAGSDSTTTVLRSTVYTLVGTPKAYHKLQTELDTASNNGELSYPIIGYAQAQRLPYLQACIWEGLRLNPPFSGLSSKLAPAGGETVKGVFYPEGTELGVSYQAMCRRKDLFGDDAEVFRPERWLEADQERKVKLRQCVDAVFGSGRFLCLGRHIAMMELSKGLAELMRNFDWAIADPMRGIDCVNHNVYIQSNMNLVGRSRA